MTRFVIFTALFLSAAAIGAEPADPSVVELPSAPVPVPPAPQPGSKIKLTGARVYAFGTKAPCDVSAFPAKLLEIESEVVLAGETLRVQGLPLFDGAKTKSFKGPQTAYFVRAGGRGEVQLTVTPFGLKGSGDIKRVVFDVDDGTKPQPPPKPDPVPPPKPKPDPKPEPVKVDSVWVVVVEDATAPRTVETAKALNDPFWLTLKPRHDWRHYLSDAKPAVDNGYVEQAKKVGYPAVLVLNAKDGDVLKAFKLATVAEIDATVKGVAK